MGADAILASNTSSISITAMANGLVRPERLVGMHFFNPVPLMKLVEVVPACAPRPRWPNGRRATGRALGQDAGHARSTPGFIVNRIARPFYGEALALLHERATEPAVLDACLRDGGLPHGAVELMDLIGHDTNFAVTESVYQANFGDKRYMPSLLQREMVDGGLLGRKSGRGFYDTTARARRRTAAPRRAAGRRAAGRTPPPGAARRRRARRALGRRPRTSRPHRAAPCRERLDRPGGRWRPAAPDRRPPATQLSAETGVRDLAVVDRPMPGVAPGGRSPSR